MIFVSIASYRDPQVIPTIVDLFKKAKNPDQIRVGLCLQHEEDETNLDPISDLNVDILEYNWRESQGTCWARHIIQKDLLQDEQYYLQLDSHHRFCDNWDQELITSIEELKGKYQKPIIGGYCPGYKPEDDTNLEPKPMRICSFADFTDLGDLMFVPRTIKNYEEMQQKEIKYIKARFLSGHFIFADSLFCKECMYDPNMYFRGEELSLSARAYTSGYDFFHPTKAIVWHEYLREKQIKHWNDHTTSNGFIVTSDQRAKIGKQRARQLLGMERHNTNFAKYGLGNVRTLHEYELYSGLCFSLKQVHYKTYDINDQYIEPHIMKESEWSTGLMKKINVEFDLPNNYFTQLNKQSVNSLGILFFDNKDILCYRKDIKKPELSRMKLDNMKMQFSVNSIPHRATLVPFTSHNTDLAKQTYIRNLRITQ